MKRLFFLFLALPLFACAPEQGPLSSRQSGARWVEYEKALAGKILEGDTYPQGNSGKGLCEWALLGSKENEVYGYALCQVAASAEGTAGSMPVVIYLAQDGTIEKVAIPMNGTEYGPSIRRLFPAEYQECALMKTCFDDSKWMAHIQQRRENPAIPPIIVLENVTLP